MQIKKGFNEKTLKPLILLWAQQDLNLRPPDYESGATNQLSYRPAFLKMLCEDNHSNTIEK